MTNISILTFGTNGDIYPSIALGVALESEGYKITLAANSNYKQTVEAYGLNFSSIDVDLENLLSSSQSVTFKNSGNNPILLAHGFLEAARSCMAEIVASCEKACYKADAVIASGLVAYCSFQIAEKLQIPIFEAYLQPNDPTCEFPCSAFPFIVPLGKIYNRMTFSIFEFLFWHTFRSLLNNTRKNLLDLPPLGLRPSKRANLRKNMITLYGYSQYFLPKPLDWGNNIYVSGYWFLDRLPHWEPSPDLVDFLINGEQPIYIGFGSISYMNTEKLLQIIIDALKITNQRAVFTHNRNTVSNLNLPPSIFSIDSVPHDWLFPRVKLAIHHGGAGTTGRSLQFGLPSITIPFLGDQFFWGYQLYKNDLGTKPLNRHHLSPLKLAEAIHYGLNSKSMKSNLGDMSSKIKSENGIQSAVQVIKRYLTY